MPSPIQIKRPEVADDIRTLAALMGVSITDAIANAVRGQLAIERVKGRCKAEKAAKGCRKGSYGIEKLTRDRSRYFR